MATLEEIRNKLLSQQQKSENKNSGGDKGMYAFWNTPEGKTSVIRFLPDADTNNTFFWVERLVIKLPFRGIVGEHDRDVFVSVPCMEMYGETCPILAETRPWWKDDSLQDLARKYWKKKSYLFQGFVVDSAFEEKDLPENPIRRFAINTSIFEIIKSSLMNPEMEDLPTDFNNGRDFKLTKTMKGGFANYGTSNWSFKTRSLSSAENTAIEQHKLFNLKDFLPKKPTAEELKAIKEMFQASVNEEAYDPQRWNNFYRPAGSFNNANSNSTTNANVTNIPDANANANANASVKKVATAQVEQEEAVATLPSNPSTPSDKDPMAILRKIQEMRQSKGN